MKICLLGNHRPSFSTESDLTWTFRDLGHTVVPVQEDETDWDYILQQSQDCKLMLWCHTHGFSVPGQAEQSMALLRAIGCTPASFSLDLFYGIWRENNYLGVHPFFKTDIFFGVDGGSSELYQKHGMKHVWIKPGVVKRDCYLAESQPDLQADVAFVGSYGYHPEWSYRPQLIDWLRATYGERFRKWGNPEETVRGDRLNKVYASTKVVVGDTLCPNFTHPYYWSDRLYETCGRSGFLIMPHVRGMTEEFQDGVHLRYYEYGDFKELKRLIDYYLVHDAEREKIRQQGFEHVRSSCTYHDRMKQLLEHLQ